MFQSKTKKERTREHIFERKKEDFLLVEINIIIYYTHPNDYKNALSG